MSIRTRTDWQGVTVGPEYTRRLQHDGRRLSFTLRAHRVLDGDHKGEFCVPLPDTSCAYGPSPVTALRSAIPMIRRLGYSLHDGDGRAPLFSRRPK